MARTVFTTGSKEEAKAQLRLVALQLEKKFPKAMETVAEAEEEALAYMGFPKGHWTQLRTANVQERLNRGLKRRMEAVPIFPDRGSRIRLAGHVLIRPARRVDGGREALCAAGRHGKALREGKRGPSARASLRKRKPKSPWEGAGLRLPREPGAA
jgi:hypothetical protein